MSAVTTARRLTVAAAIYMVLFHLYAALPPHVNVGRWVVALTTVYGVVLLTAMARRHGGMSRAGKAS